MSASVADFHTLRAQMSATGRRLRGQPFDYCWNWIETGPLPLERYGIFRCQSASVRLAT